MEVLEFLGNLYKVKKRRKKIKEKKYTLCGGMSVCPSVTHNHCLKHQKDFFLIWYWRHSQNATGKLSFSQ